MKAILTATSAALLLAACASNGMDDTQAASESAAMLSPAALDFVRGSASGNLYEIESSRLALERSQNPAVRAFAQQMINDHNALTSEMMSALSSLGMPPMQPMLLPHHQQMVSQLQGLSGPAFDAEYHRQQMMAHQESLNLHQAYASNGDNPTLRNLAARAVPVIQGHINQAQMHGGHMMQPGMQQPMQPSTNRRAGERG